LVIMRETRIFADIKG